MLSMVPAVGCDQKGCGPSQVSRIGKKLVSVAHLSLGLTAAPCRAVAIVLDVHRIAWSPCPSVTG